LGFSYFLIFLFSSTLEVVNYYSKRNLENGFNYISKSYKYHYLLYKAKMKNVIAAKAYRNEKFLASEGARNIRILCECTESQQRLAEHGVTATILFFGSARAKSKENHASLVADVEAKLAVARAEQNATDISSFELKADALARSKWMSEYFDKVQELSKKVTEWSVNPNVSLGPDCKVTGVTRYHETNTASATAATTSATTPDVPPVTLLPTKFVIVPVKDVSLTAK